MGWVVEILTTPLMQRALVVAVLVGVAAPVMGTYLVQRRLALLGDGIGHVALTGVAVGWLVGSAVGVSDAGALAVPGAIVASVVGSLMIEFVRARGKTSGDIALAILFYGGIAGGVLIITLAGGTTANLNAYLFGSIAAVAPIDIVFTAVLAVVVLGVGIGLRGPLFALCHDEEFARAAGLPVRALTVLIAVMAALTVSVSMRVVGVLLVSALMIVPVATAQLVTRSFRGTMATAMLLGLVICVTGLVLTYLYPLTPGATIVVLAIAVYAVVSIVRPLLGRRGPHGDPHPDVEDDVRVREAA
ncbi:metal ABC transporter permease [Georgenia deserti]|uniref:Metal ABC transporter permease n=1 Tax=Georgenia deserti TaxID=2093781 RepID=A0ABW4L9C3_9MICO